MPNKTEDSMQAMTEKVNQIKDLANLQLTYYIDGKKYTKIVGITTAEQIINAGYRLGTAKVLSVDEIERIIHDHMDYYETEEGCKGVKESAQAIHAAGPRLLKPRKDPNAKQN